MAKNKNKNYKVLYSIITSLTMILPTSITLFISAIWSNPTPDYVVVFESDENIKKVDDLIGHITVQEHNKKEYIAFIDFDKYSVYNTDFTYYEKVENVVVEGEEKTGYRFGKEDYIQFIGDNINVVIELNKDSGTLAKVSNIHKETGNKLTIAFFVSAFTSVIIVLIIAKKMRLFRKKPRLATFITLVTVTTILWVIDTIIGNMLTMFLVATLSWGMYCVEYLVYHNNILGSEENENKISALAKELKEYYDEYK